MESSVSCDSGALVLVSILCCSSLSLSLSGTSAPVVVDSHRHHRKPREQGLLTLQGLLTVTVDGVPE